MNLTRSILRFPAVAAVAALALAACSDEPTSLSRRAVGDAALRLEASSASAPAGSRVGIAVRLEGTPVAGFQGRLRYDAARLRYVGQSPIGGAVTMVNQELASQGELRFTSFDVDGMTGRVANFVFEARGNGYLSDMSYVHEVAATSGDQERVIALAVERGVSIDPSVPAPSDARVFSVGDWMTELNYGANGGTVALRPGEVRNGLFYGNVNYDLVGGVGAQLIDVFDILILANAAVGNRELIIGTDGPAAGSDVDIVIAGNVAPATVVPFNGTTVNVCGTEANGSRVIDVFDLLAIANEIVGNARPCVGELIRPAAPTGPNTVISATSTPDLIVTSGETLTLTNDQVWQLDGALRVQDGGVLNIQAGTTVLGNTSFATTQAVIVNRGGRINAVGTPGAPIIFSCTAPVKFKGCWGGVFISGRAIVNVGDGVDDTNAATNGDPNNGCGATYNSRVAEGGIGTRYGGCVSTDNSGIIQYARIEYAGKIIGVANELNGLTLGGVGSGTKISYVQIHGGLDDGIEFFGGSVNTDHLVLTANDDDQFDLSFGYTGTSQFALMIADDGGLTGTAAESRAIEADGYEGGNYSTTWPSGLLGPPALKTTPTMANFTMIGPLATGGVGGQLGIMARRGTGFTLLNSLLMGYPNGLDIRDPITCVNTYGSKGVVIDGLSIVNVGDAGDDDVDGTDPVAAAADYCGAARTATTGLEDSFLLIGGNNQVNPDFTPGVPLLPTQIYRTDPYVIDFADAFSDWRLNSTSGLSAAVAQPVGSGLQTAAYRGALPPVANGVAPWYSGWTIGWSSEIPLVAPAP